MTQTQALDLLMMGHNVFLTGQAGSGKTYLLNQYITFLKKHKVTVAITASTGIAATHIGGNTIHSWSGIGIKNYLANSDLDRICANLKLVDKIQNTKVLIIDEISMFDAPRLDMVNVVCKQIKNDPRAFGGIQVILCGDFFQLPPIGEFGQKETSFAFKSNAWSELDLKICYLMEQHRQLDDSFLRLLNEIRSQEVSEYTIEKLATRKDQPIAGNKTPTKLYTHNIDVDTINNLELKKINQPENKYQMHSHGKKELVLTLKKGCLAPEELVLKIGALVIFIKNNLAKGYVNGTLGKVIDFDEDDNPIIETFSGRKITATPTTWQYEDNNKVVAEISQIPLRLAWAITVHKSQGMSLDAAEIDLSKSFSYGMGYVALSRVKSLDGIKLLGINSQALMVDSEIAEFDRSLISQSTRVSSYLKQLDEAEIKKAQQQFLENIIDEKTASRTQDQILKDLVNKFLD